jgi:hypothetical protein
VKTFGYQIKDDPIKYVLRIGFLGDKLRDSFDFIEVNFEQKPASVSAN